MQYDSVVNCFQLQLLWRFLKVMSISTTSNELKWHLQPILPPICDKYRIWIYQWKQNREWLDLFTWNLLDLEKCGLFWWMIGSKFFLFFLSQTSLEICIKKVNRVNFDVTLTSKVKTWSIDWDLVLSLYPWAGHLTSGVTPGRLSHGKCTVSCFWMRKHLLNDQ